MDGAEKKQVYADIMSVLRFKSGKSGIITVENLLQNHLSIRPEHEIRECIDELIDGDYPVSWKGRGSDVLVLTNNDRAEKCIKELRDEIFS